MSKINTNEKARTELITMLDSARMLVDNKVTNLINDVLYELNDDNCTEYLSVEERKRLKDITLVLAYKCSGISAIFSIAMNELGVGCNS